MPEPTTELLDSVSYHKHEYAKIDATGWSFEKNDGNGGMLPWLIALILAAGIVVMLHIKRKGNSLTPDPSPEEYSQGRNAGTDATTPLSNRRGGEATFLERAQEVVNAHLADEDFNAGVAVFRLMGFGTLCLPRLHMHGNMGLIAVAVSQ